jgi:hypothetical protein
MPGGSAMTKVYEEDRKGYLLRLPVSLSDRAKREAADQSVSLNLLIEQAVSAYLDQPEDDAAHIDALETAGICVVCEKAPVAPEDVMCAACRAVYEGRTSEITDPVEQTLSAHLAIIRHPSYTFQLCLCGWSIQGGPPYHRRHVAEHVYAALGLPGPAPWVDGPLVVHPEPHGPQG